MKCIARLKVIDGLTQPQQIHLLASLITQITFFLRQKSTLPIINSYTIRKLEENETEWCVEISFDKIQINNVMRVLCDSNFNVLNGNIYSYEYSE